MAKSTTSFAPPPTELFVDAASDDDEDSFVVLSTSLPPTPSSDSGASTTREIENAKMINASVIEEALSLVQNHISNMSDSTSGFPSIPHSTDDLVIPINELHLNAITTNSSVSLSPDEIQQKVDLLVEENIKLKETLHQNNLAMKNQYETLVLWQEDVMKVHQSHKQQFADTKKYIENLKTENVRLKALNFEQSKTLPTINTTTVTEKSPAELINSNLVEFELETARKKISALEIEIKLLQTEKLSREKSCELQNSLEARVDSLQKELDNCKQMHEREIAGYTQQVQQSESLQKILLDEIKMLKTKQTDHFKCIKQENLDNVHEQLMAAQMHITKLELLKNQDKELINAQQMDITKLKAKEAEVQDEVIALKTQLQLYESNFETEKKQRHSLIAEKEEIATNLQQLQRRNNQLLEEVERLRIGDFVCVSGGGSAGAATSPSAPQRTPSKFECPKCSFAFLDYSALENHVYRCIDIDSLF